MRFLLVYILLSLAPSLMAQTGQNPFDIKERIPETATTDTLSHRKIRDANNAFDIDRPSAPTRSIPAPSASSVEAEEPDSIATSVAASTPQVTKEVGSTNPFEVSHIPIRRSQLKEKADAFTTTVKQSNSQSPSSGIFLFWFILISAILIAIVINTKKNTIPALAKSILNENMLKYNYREENGGIVPQYLLLYVSFFINAATLAYLLVGKYMSMSGLTVFGYSVAAVIGVYLLKHTAIKILGWIFPINTTASLYNFTIESFNIFVGMLLIPLNLVIAFGPKGLAIIFLYIAVALVCLFLILRIVRALVLAAPYIQEHLFHFFLYLCAFELVPLMLLIKAVQ